MDVPPVQYVTTSDGYSIACSVSGAGTNLILMPEPVSHIQLYWTANTYVRPWLEGLSKHFRLILYDGRGQGMSTHDLPPDHSVMDELRDLEAVIEHMRLDTFVLVARSHAAVHYAVQHPDRVDALILVSTAVSGAAFPSGWAEDLAGQDWELFLRTLAGLVSPSDPESLERLRQSTTQGDWLARGRASRSSDVTALLPQLDVPVLVIQPRDYPVTSVEESRRLAAAIPGARMIVIDGASSRGDPEQGVRAIQAFVDDVATAKASQEQLAGQGAMALSSRELDVLRLIAAGRRNTQIAEALVISPNTVQRHVSNIFDKIGAANRAEATAYALRNGLA
jgi:pimeloyl-ACP methyl ester carboxylesterase/DNA-binding CsgD family transcriptional regulator